MLFIDNNMLSSYRGVVEQAFLMNRIDEKTRLKLLSSNEFLKELVHLKTLRSNYRLYGNKAFENAALNHDVIEKGLLCYKELQAEFGKETADLIAGVTDYKYADRRGCFLREWIPNRGFRELTWQERKEITLERLKKSDVNVLILKLCDAEGEICEIEKYGCRRFDADFKSLKWYYGELLKLFKEREEIRLCRLMRSCQSNYRKVFYQSTK